MQFLYISEQVDPKAWIRSSFINDILRIIMENLNIYNYMQKIIAEQSRPRKPSFFVLVFPPR